MKKELLTNVEILHKNGTIYNIKATEKEIKKALKEYNNGENVLVVNGIDEGYFFNMDEVSIVNYKIIMNAEMAIRTILRERNIALSDKNNLSIVEVIKEARARYKESNLSIKDLKDAYDNYFRD